MRDSYLIGRKKDRDGEHRIAIIYAKTHSPGMACVEPLVHDIAIP